MDMKILWDRYSEALNWKGRWLALYSDLYLYVLTNRDAFNIKFNYEDMGKPTSQEVWDPTAQRAAKIRANELGALLFPMDRRWGGWKLNPRYHDVDEIKAKEEYLDDINETILFYHRQSNFNRVLTSSNLDHVGGTGVIWVESPNDDTPLYYRSIPAVATCIEYSTDDTVTTAWFQQKMSGRLVLDKFPNYRGRLRSALEGNPNDLVQVIYGQVGLGPKRYYIYAVLAEDQYTPLFEYERSYQQCIIYRDYVRPGEAEGTGIALDLMPQIKDLNKLVKERRKSNAYKADPTMFIDSNMKLNQNSFFRWSGAMIERKPGGPNPIEPLIMPEYPSVLTDIQDLREQITLAFQVEPLGLMSNTTKSATEIQIRENRWQRNTATDIGRLINEGPKQIWEIETQILYERGLLAKAPSKEFDLFNHKILFEYDSPLFDVQNQEDLNNFVQNCQIKQQFFGEGAALASINVGKASEFLTEKLRLPANLFKTDKEMAGFLQQMGQLAQGQLGLPNPSTGALPIQGPQPQPLLG